MISLRELLQKVDKLIDSNKYKQIEGDLAAGDCGRCYLGLVCQALVDKGYYEWGEGN
jgi:hypothetical protein